MKLRFGMLLAGVALVVAMLGVLSPAGSVAAQEPETIGALDAPYFFGEDAAVPRWMRYSIVHCAAKAMGVDIDRVKLGLQRGSSLKEMGIGAGVRPAALESGILRCEHNLLERLVASGELEPLEARRIMNFLRQHMTRIINYTWGG